MQAREPATPRAGAVHVSAVGHPMLGAHGAADCSVVGVAGARQAGAQQGGVVVVGHRLSGTETT